MPKPAAAHSPAKAPKSRSKNINDIPLEHLAP